MTARPYRLRLLLDVELTEDEWALLAQANLPDPPPERSLALVIYDQADRYPCEEPQAVIEARPARLLLNTRPVPIRTVEDVAGRKASPLEVLELDREEPHGPPVVE